VTVLSVLYVVSVPFAGAALAGINYRIQIETEGQLKVKNNGGIAG